MAKDFSTYSDAALFAVLMTPSDYTEKAFAEIYARYSQKVYLYCTKVMGNRHDAHDLFQETWMKFHSAAQKADTVIENVGGYLFKIARNLCLNKKRQQHNQHVTFEEFYAVSYDTTLEQKEFSELLNRALDILDDGYREAYVLHEMEGMPYEEMSGITGDSVPALKNRVWRARKQIREFLAPFLIES